MSVGTGVGRYFRETLERQHKYVASGHAEPHTPTTDRWDETTLDFVALPGSYADVIRQATVLKKSVRLLHHAKVRRPRDHDPVAVRFEHSPFFFKPDEQKRPHLDTDLLGLAMGVHGENRARSTGRKGTPPSPLHDGRSQMEGHRRDSAISRHRSFRQGSPQ